MAAGESIWYNEEKILGEGSLGTYVFEGRYQARRFSTRQRQIVAIPAHLRRDVT